MDNKKNIKQIEITNTSDFLKNILESSIEYSIIAADLDGTILTWNTGAEHNYGYAAEEMVGKQNIFKLHIPEDIKSGRAHEFINSVLKEGKAEAIFERLRNNSAHFTASVVMTLRKDSDGKPIGYLLISKNISEQIRLEEQLKINRELQERNRYIEESNRLKSEFLANMSHELRTPLNAIIGFSELMYDERMGAVTEEQKEGLSDVITSAKHLLTIINDLLDISKVEAGKLEFDPLNCNLKSLMNEVTSNLRPWFQKKQIHLITHVDQEIENVYLDPSRFKQILYNLLSNAIKFTPDLGTVQIRMLPETSTAFRLEIEDNGIGIKPEDVTKLFHSFTQLDSGITKKFEGTGLGLALTKQIVEAQHGTIGVESTINKGSTFYVILPRQYQNQIKSDFSPEGQVQIYTKNALVIEDDENEINWITNTLQDNGFMVDQARSGEQAIKHSNNTLYDLITIDLILPDVNGFEVLKSINSSRNKNTPSIVISVVPEKQQWVGFLIDDYLTKPINKETLLSAVKRACEKSQKIYKILVIDDDSRSLKLITKLLDGKGYEVTCTTEAKEGLELAKTQNPDIIVLDLSMPEMDGYEFLQRFSKTSRDKKIPIIVWTVTDITTSENKILKDSVQAIVLKSIGDSIKMLLMEIKKLTAHDKA